jgi:hypothetical protein
MQRWLVAVLVVLLAACTSAKPGGKQTCVLDHDTFDDGCVFDS